MAIPVEIEGKSYLMSLPTLRDWVNFQELLTLESRKQGYAAIPNGLSDTEFQRWVNAIDKQVDAINPHTPQALDKLLQLPGGAALYYYSLLRRDNPKNPEIDLSWVENLIERAKDGVASAMEALKSIRQGVTELYAEAAKNLESGPRLPRKNPSKRKQPTGRKRTQST